MSSRLYQLIDQNQIVIKFERAINDLRKGLPIMFNKSSLIFACETIDANTLDALHNDHKVIILNKNRAAKIGIETSKDIGIDIDIVSLKFINSLIASQGFSYKGQNFTTNKDYEHILSILNLANLLPAAILVKDAPFNINLININNDEIEQYKSARQGNFSHVCTAPVAIKGTKNVKIAAFRPTISEQEHYAIIIGDPEKAERPLVRIHSSCFAGDLIESLSCNCSNQLYESIKMISESKEAAGIIFYIMQDSRGIGLTNKLRTYLLQDSDYDASEAKLALGFTTDSEKDFIPVSKILKLLNIRAIKLITNNHLNAEDLVKNGISVKETAPLIPKDAKIPANFQTKLEGTKHRK